MQVAVLNGTQATRASPARPLRSVHRPANFEFRLAHRPVGGAIKRVLDVIVASIALIFLAPVLLLAAILIKLDSQGPILFRQRRTGFRGRSFFVLKFRTMRQMDSGRGFCEQAQRQDPRVTRIGRFLRKTSIDELPQILNVLRGEMSLVGPRPHALAHDNAFWTQDSHYVRRFVARPGITGLAQVNGARGLSDTPEKVRRRVELDLDYVERWSFLRDIGIMAATLAVLVHDKNAF